MASGGVDDAAAAEVAAMQFAGGRSIAQVAEAWERDMSWVEAAIRRALLETIPRCQGGLKAPRVETRAANAAELTVAAIEQGELEWGS